MTQRVILIGLILMVGAMPRAGAAPTEPSDLVAPSEPPEAAADEPLEEPAALEAFPGALTLKPGEIRSLAVRGLRRIAIGNPAVLDVRIVSANELLLQAKATGTTNLILWDDEGQHVSSVDVVDQAPDQLEAQLTQLLRELNLSGVRLKREDSRFFLVGEVASQREMDQLEQMLSAYKEQVTNLVALPEPPPPPPPAPVQAVKLTVQLIEMNRDATDKLGVDWNDSLTFTETTFGAAGPTGASLPARLREAFRIGSLTRTGFSQVLNMLVSQGKARILSEPKLVASSGKEATASLGVEVPIITTTSVSAGTVSQNIEFKKTGVEMKFTPTVLNGDGQEISLVIDAKVSSVDKSVAIVVSGITVPGFKVRHTTTEITTGSGQTVFITGLLQDEEKKNISQVPGAGSIPVLGNLFRSTEFTLGQTELVMVVTPEIAAGQEASLDRTYALEQALASAEVADAVSDPALRYALQVQERIARSLRYPQGEQEAGRSGTVKLRLHLFRDGTLGHVMVTEPSGSELLDTEALKAAESQAPYPPFPSDLPQQDLWLELPVLFRL